MARFFTKAYGSAVIARNLVGQRRVPYLPAAQLREMRDKRVRQMVRYAAETVPYYGEFFRSEGINPEEIHGAEDLCWLPLLDKDTVRSQSHLFRSTSSQGRNAVPFPTTGSTGTPLTVHHDRYSLLMHAAWGERERDVLRNVLGTGWRPRALFIDYPGATGDLHRSFLRQNVALLPQSNRITVSLLEPLDRVVATINDFRPELICSYGSYLELLFRMVSLGSLRLHPPRVLLYLSDAMTEGGRRLIEEQFDIRVLSRYVCVEALKVAFTCEEGRAFHLHDDLVHVRIVGPDGQAVAPGEKGEVVVSNLVNRGTVLLNYRLGDMAALVGEPCTCGRNLTLLTDLEGRVEDIIYLPGGRFLHPRVICSAFENRKDVLQYQLIQHSLDRFHLRLVPVDWAHHGRTTAELRQGLVQLLGTSAKLEITYHDRLPRQAGGKFRPVLSLLRHAGR
jgi:phenylacetate-CoA ligase